MSIQSASDFFFISDDVSFSSDDLSKGTICIHLSQGWKSINPEKSMPAFASEMLQLSAALAKERSERAVPADEDLVFTVEFQG